VNKKASLKNFFNKSNPKKKEVIFQGFSEKSRISSEIRFGPIPLEFPLK
jgi:hypothetical protein